jgi:hypothetical protein
MDRSSKRPCAAGRDTFLPTALRQTACPVNSGVTRITGRSGLSRDSAHHIGHAPPAGACKANATTAQRRDGKSSVHRSAPVARSGFRRCSKGGSQDLVIRSMRGRRSQCAHSRSARLRDAASGQTADMAQRDQPVEAPARRPSFGPAGVLLGIALGGFVDGILLHQVLHGTT